MALIFHQFTSLANAASFAACAKETYGRNCVIYTDAEEAANADFYPFTLVAPVVLVERTEDDDDEGLLMNLVTNFQGSFAGT